MKHNFLSGNMNDFGIVAHNRKIKLKLTVSVQNLVFILRNLILVFDWLNEIVMEIK